VEGDGAVSAQGSRHVRVARGLLPARSAAGLAFASAAVSCYWTAGGAFLLDTVGGAIEELARERSLGAVALGAGTVVLKLVAGVLALALLHPPADAFRRRVLILANGVASAILCVWAASTSSWALWSSVGQ
jgi:hypothetical protein